MSDPLDDGQTYDCFFKKGDRVLHEAEKRIGRVTRVRWDRELKTFKCEYVSELKVVKVIGPDSEVLENYEEVEGEEIWSALEDELQMSV